MRDIELQIEELIIDATSPADGLRVGEAFSRELTRLLEASHGTTLFSHQQTIKTIDAGSFATAASARPSAIGEAAAQAVHRGLSR